MADRINPLGYDEYKGNLPSGKSASTFIHNGVPYTVFSPPFFNDPDVQTHERIHQGQLQLRNQIGIPQLQRALNLFQNYPPPTNDPQFETPAWSFSTVESDPGRRAQQQMAFNAYIDELRRVNPSVVDKVTAQAPVELQRGYVNRPIPPIEPNVPAPSDFLSKIMGVGALK